MAYSLAQAAKAIGRDRSTLLRMIKIGRLSAARDEATGAWLIEPVELHRVYPPADAHVENPPDAQLRTPDSTSEIAVLLARLEAAAEAIRVSSETVADLRRRLDRADEERRQAQAQVAGLLADRRDTAPNGAPSPQDASKPNGAGTAHAPNGAPPASVRRSWWPWSRR